MKILVFGSRNWVEQKPIERELRKFPRGTVIVQGGARGADNIGGYVGELCGLEVRDYPVDEAVDGSWPAAGVRRNQRMLDSEHPDKNGEYIDRALCFHEDPNLGKGSKDMAARLEKANITFEVYRR